MTGPLLTSPIFIPSNKDLSMITCGLFTSATLTNFFKSSSLYAKPLPSPPNAYAARTSTGYPIFSAWGQGRNRSFYAKITPWKTKKNHHATLRLLFLPERNKLHPLFGSWKEREFSNSMIHQSYFAAKDFAKYPEPPSRKQN